MAITVAETFANKYKFRFQNLLEDNAVKNKEEQKEVTGVLTLKNKEKTETLYLINYKNHGFAVVPADQRLIPVLAYSENHNMPTTKTDTIPGGLEFWVENQIAMVDKIRDSKNKTTSTTDRLWNTLLGENKQKITPPGDDCEPWIEDVDPLLETEWGQGNGYNLNAPDLNCDQPTNGRALAGCVPVAMAQVVRYHEYPNTFGWDWSSMPNIYGNSEVSDLIEDVSATLGMIRDDYHCYPDATGVSVSKVATAFGNLGYSVDRMNYAGTNNYQDVMDNLDAGNPVVFSGFEEEYWAGVFPINGSGHMWVGDGYTQWKDCPSGNIYLNFHMNWGWNGNYNGYFGYMDFTPANEDFNYHSDVFVNIEP